MARSLARSCLVHGHAGLNLDTAALSDPLERGQEKNGSGFRGSGRAGVKQERRMDEAHWEQEPSRPQEGTPRGRGLGGTLSHVMGHHGGAQRPTWFPEASLRGAGARLDPEPAVERAGQAGRPGARRVRSVPANRGSR